MVTGCLEQDPTSILDNRGTSVITSPGVSEIQERLDFGTVRRTVPRIISVSDSQSSTASALGSSHKVQFVKVVHYV